MSEKTPGVLVILLNGTPMLEYDRGQALSDRQRESLQRMEEKLDQGILLGERFVTRPERQQRVEYMAANLVAALLEGKDVAAAASCAYLAMALPELKQVRALEKEGNVAIELVFDREYRKEEKLSFVPQDRLKARH
ncbi:MAG: hypothetical protein OXI37_04550 [Gammaproteobacteria bacterium]|nr:hypothetical protein [Gammaproteobacteria bacterium]